MIPPNTPLRTMGTYLKYLEKPEYDGCFMCDAPAIREFEHWKIIENEYPYDAVAEVSHMLVPKRHVDKQDNLTLSEDGEIYLDDCNFKGYDAIQRNFPHAQSHPSHLHYHLLKWRRV